MHNVITIYYKTSLYGSFKLTNSNILVIFCTLIASLSIQTMELYMCVLCIDKNANMSILGQEKKCFSGFFGQKSMRVGGFLFYFLEAWLKNHTHTCAGTWLDKLAGT